MKKYQTLLAFLPHALFSVTVYLSWHWPKTQISAALAILAALILAYITKSGSISAGKIYKAGCIINLLGFYWLAETVSFFGGFSKFFGIIVFLFFVFISSLQFSLFAFIFNRLPILFGVFKLPLAWFAAEFLFPRIFPWELASPLSAIPVLSQLADIAGSYFVSFMLLAVCACFFKSVYSEQKRISFIITALLLVSWIYYGILVTRVFNLSAQNSYGKLDVSIVQANVEVVQQGDIAVIKQNKNKYVSLTRSVLGQNIAPDLIIWPEAVLQDWVYIDVGNVFADPRIPFFPGVALLTGALTFETQERFFNSALYTDNKGNIPEPYHKRILMPFGEYMPFSGIFPFLNEVNKNLALFTAGNKTLVYSIENKERQILNFSALICYEDLMPRLSRDAVLKGADFLVNLTNDAWFGKGPAAEHHGMIASFRAIENKRYLLRSTNTGLTQIVNPLGITESQLLPETEATLNSSIKDTEYQTLYSLYASPGLFWLTALLILFLSKPFKINLKSK